MQAVWDRLFSKAAQLINSSTVKIDRRNIGTSFRAIAKSGGGGDFIPAYPYRFHSIGAADDETDYAGDYITAYPWTWTDNNTGTAGSTLVNIALPWFLRPSVAIAHTREVDSDTMTYTFPDVGSVAGLKSQQRTATIGSTGYFEVITQRLIADQDIIFAAKFPHTGVYLSGVELELMVVNEARDWAFKEGQ